MSSPSSSLGMFGVAADDEDRADRPRQHQPADQPAEVRPVIDAHRRAADTGQHAEDQVDHRQHDQALHLRAPARPKQLAVLVQVDELRRDDRKNRARRPDRIAVARC